MKITQEIHEMGDNDVPARQTITIEIEPGDDNPTGFLNGLVMPARGRLESFLLGYADILRYSREPHSDGEIWHVLTTFGYVAQRAEMCLNGMMVIARDQYGKSWREIASALDMHQSTVRRRVASERREFAGLGIWFDSEGMHRTADGEAALAITERREKSEK
jgi:hypothetical protein